MIINALDSNSQSTFNTDIIEWCNNNQANVLTIDPPLKGTHIDTKWSMGIALPLDLPESCGRHYLCDVGIPAAVFKELNISYKSPFAHKFYIPLQTE